MNTATQLKALIRNISKETIEKMFDAILAVNLNDSVAMTMNSI